MEVTQFEIGKCYRHSNGSEIKIVGLTETTGYGRCLLAENAFRP